MFTKILIANRGEIACRVAQTARRMGVKTVAVFSDADAGALHVESADEAVALGGITASESYLDIEKIISAAQSTGAQAIHPGYGFLSENTAFSARCQAEGIAFIGPDAEAIRLMGSKRIARVTVAGFDVPVLPGYDEEDQDPLVLADAADRIGYPVLIKATSGGGGKGMRVVENNETFTDALAAVRRESEKSFGDDRVILEKYLPQARHVKSRSSPISGEMWCICLSVTARCSDATRK